MSPTVVGFALSLSHASMAGANELSLRVTLLPAQGAGVPRGAPSPRMACVRAQGGVSQALFCLNLPLAGAWGGRGGPWVGSGEPRGVVYSHGACFLPPASGEAVSDLLVKPDEPSRSGFLPGSASPRWRVPPRPLALLCPPPQPQRRVPLAAGLAWAPLSQPGGSTAAVLGKPGATLVFGASAQISTGRLCWARQSPRWLGRMEGLGGCCPGVLG